MATRKIDWFKADRALSLEVAEYMRVKVWYAEYQKKYEEKIRPLKDVIRLLEKGELHAISQTNEELKASTLLRISELESEHEKLVEEHAKWEMSDSAKALRKALKKGDSVQAICDFFAGHGLDITGTGFAEGVVRSGGERDFDRKTYVNSNGNTVTCEDTSRIFRMVFSKAYEAMVQAGTIKVQQVPALLMWHYNKCYEARRKAAKKAAKSAK